MQWHALTTNCNKLFDFHISHEKFISAWLWLGLSRRHDTHTPFARQVHTRRHSRVILGKNHENVSLCKCPCCHRNAQARIDCQFFCRFEKGLTVWCAFFFLFCSTSLIIILITIERKHSYDIYGNIVCISQDTLRRSLWYNRQTDVYSNPFQLKCLCVKKWMEKEWKRNKWRFYLPFCIIHLFCSGITALLKGCHAWCRSLVV